MEKIAYLSNPYPAISHTFIFREIESLRKEGLDIASVSVSATPDLDKMTLAEQKEADRTLVLKNTSLLKIILSAITLLVHSPAGLSRMSLQALSFCYRGPANPVKAAGYFAEAIILLAWLREQKITHIHEHFGNPTAFVAMLCKSYGGISYSLSIHGPDIFTDINGSMLAEKVKNASFVRCISQYCKSQVMQVSPYEHWRNHHIIRCGVDPQLYEKRPKQENTVPRILCVGRLCPAKGQHLLLEACSILQKRGYTFEVVLVGDGPERESLEKLRKDLGLENQVHFKGILGQEEVRNEYQQADLFILPSFSEGIPVVLMEAMAMEIPVISTRITGIPELIDHGSDGLLATPGDVDDLVRKIQMLLFDSRLRLHLGKAGRNKIQDKYNQRKNNAELAALFSRKG